MADHPEAGEWLVTSLADIIAEQAEAEAQAAAGPTLEDAAMRGTVPRGYGVEGSEPLPLTVTYDEGEQAAYIQIGRERTLRRRSVQLDRGVRADFDTAGRIAGLKITGVTAPTREDEL
jgi:hypothetical protein